MKRIPCIIHHGIQYTRKTLAPERFEEYLRILSEMGFETVTYDDLAKWRSGDADLPSRPVMIDVDHPRTSVRYEIFEAMRKYSFVSTLFVNTGGMEEMYKHPLPERSEREFMTWEEINDLIEAGWLIGAHTHTHPCLSALSVEDPSGNKIAEELEINDEIIRTRLGVTPRDFAFTGTSWSSIAEREVKKRYRFGRLWICGSEYKADGRKIRFAELAGAEEPDESDGGPPFSARYITKQTDPYRLPSMELLFLIFDYDDFRKYLENSMTDSHYPIN